MDDFIRQVAVTGGSGPIELGAPDAGYSSFKDGGTFYSIIDGANREVGFGSVSGGILYRTAVYATLIDGIYAKSGTIFVNEGAYVQCSINANTITKVQNDIVRALTKQSVVSLNGPTVILKGKTAEYVITDYNSLSTYEVSIDNPLTSVSMVDDVITVTVDASVTFNIAKLKVTKDGSDSIFKISLDLSEQSFIPYEWGPLPLGLNSGGEVAALPINTISASGGSFVAGLDNGFAALSTDGGLTWSDLPRGLNSGSTPDINAIASSGETFIAGCDSGYASISTDGGLTWAGLSLGEASTTRAIAASGETFVAGFSTGRATISTDGGVAWSALPQYLNSGASSSIYALAASGDTFVAGFVDGYASISTDNGLTWSALPQGLNSGTTTGDVRSIAASGDVFVVGFQYGFASISTDNGLTWSALPQGLNSGSTSDDIRALANNGTVWVAGFAGGYASVSPPL